LAVQIREQVSLREWTWWKIGGLVEFFGPPETVEDVREAVQFAQSRKLQVTVLGGGTNVLISDAGVAGLVIAMRKLTGTNVTETAGRLHIQALAGTPKAELLKPFLSRRMAPALFLCGLPGDLGGGVAMNAGVGEEIRPREFVEITDSIEVVSLEGPAAVRRLNKGDLRWSYRSSTGWQPGIIVSVSLSWPLGQDDEIPAKVKEATRNRLRRQPLELPSCGSTFKNPPGHHAGQLIEQAGLKGFQVGEAQVSTKHANFIVNLGSAKAADVHTIIQQVQTKVDEKFGVRLEPEVKYLGRWP
jgi:UDP-N-acetylmuramate dehydrogenase